MAELQKMQHTALQNMQKVMADNMKAMFAQMSGQQSVQQPDEQHGEVERESSHIQPSTQEDNENEDQDPYVLHLQDRQGYDSDGKSVMGNTNPISHTVTHQSLQDPQLAQRNTRATSPGSTSHVSDYESDNLFLRLKRQREVLLDEVAIAGGFTRDNPATAKITGMSRELVGTYTAPPNLILPWSTDISEHVTVHNRIINGTMTRSGVPKSSSFSKAHPWKMGEYFKEGDLGKTTPFPKAYRPFPQTTDCASEAAKLECTPQAQPFEHANAQGFPQGKLIDLSQGRVSLSDNYLAAQENLNLRTIGALNSIDTIIRFMASEQEHLSPERLAEVYRHARFDIAAGTSYAWRSTHNIRLLRRQAAIDVLKETRSHPPLSQTNLQDLYRAPLNADSVFGGQLAATHKDLVSKLQVRPIVVNAPFERQGERKSVSNRGGYNPDHTFRRPYNQGPPPKKPQQRSQKRPNYSPQGPPAKRHSPAGDSSFTSSSGNTPPPQGSNRGRGRGQGGPRGRGKSIIGSQGATL
jgi:hypothetical protein